MKAGPKTPAHSVMTGATSYGVLLTFIYRRGYDNGNKTILGKKKGRLPNLLKALQAPAIPSHIIAQNAYLHNNQGVKS